MKLSKPFIRLPFNFDVERLRQEVANIPNSARMPHPSGAKGNSSVPLISVDGANNDLFHGAMAITPHLQQSPYMMQVLAHFGEVLTRSRLMLLGPWAKVPRHVDSHHHWHNRVRIHVPIFTKPEVSFHCDDEQIHMKAGECWIFDTWRPHSVHNNNEEDRVHLVIDTCGSSKFWRMVREMENFEYTSNESEYVDKINFVPFIEGKTVEILTETYNVTPVMTPGELDGLITDLISEFADNSGNDRHIAEQYKNMLLDFTKDWRQLWSMFGFSEQGQSTYNGLLKQLHNQLLPDNKVCSLLKSNNLNLNDIIRKRLLMAAVIPTVSKQF